MPRQNSRQRATIGRVMHEFKHGELDSARGDKVRSPRQAVAIALSEAGASKAQGGAANRRQARRSAAKEAAGRTAQAEKEGQARAQNTLLSAGRRHQRSTENRSRAELYAEARSRGIAGRSKMSKAELVRVLSH